jgi:hypothetical protein
MKLTATVLLVLTIALSACAPGLDWREVNPAESGVHALFPCKPEVSNRPATPTEPGRMGLAHCKAAGLSFALAWAELADPAQITPALMQMRLSVASKLGATAAAPQAMQLPGMTPNSQAQWQSLIAPSQQAKVAVFSRGLLVYQLVMMGPKRDDAAWENFVASIRLDS